ncbi:MAG: hydrolase 1, exosortase A system-associated, partial [Novosphingobium sp.]|nr:hydrolase 1, exosortase A system-associated [Novosphingobium sp.]
MTRRHLTFDCAGATLVGTLDMADGATGLLIVSGGNELRSGAWAGQAKLAARIAEAGYPVFRFDRRGVGDSEGANGGFRSEGPDIDSAIAAFRAAAPRLERIVGLGNCDAASALMLARGAGLDALLLANPWTTEDDKARDPPEVIWAHYRQRLASKTALMRLLSGRVKFRAIAPAIAAALAPTR